MGVAIMELSREVARHVEVQEEFASLQGSWRPDPPERPIGVVSVDRLLCLASKGIRCEHRHISGRVICPYHETCGGATCFIFES
jgi:hypothetical protein